MRHVEQIRWLKITHFLVFTLCIEKMRKTKTVNPIEKGSNKKWWKTNMSQSWSIFPFADWKRHLVVVRPCGFFNIQHSHKCKSREIIMLIQELYHPYQELVSNCTTENCWWLKELFRDSWLDYVSLRDSYVTKQLIFMIEIKINNDFVDFSCN